MGQYLNVGNAGFTSIRKGKYVDKTGLIDYINSTLGTKEKLTCVSRPRRFGKSFAAQMLCAYYDKSCDSRELFEGLEISQSPDFERHLNQYDVIYLDITWFISLVGKKENIKDVVQVIHREVTSELKSVYPDVPPYDTLPKMLLSVSEMTGNKFIFIIDEWDALFREAQDNKTLLDEYIRLLRGLFKSSGQTDKMIQAVYMTGILPIKKYGTHSAMTDFQEFTMLNPEPLEEYVGFTEPEVRELCQKSVLRFEQLQQWYDGYAFGETVHIYSPKSVIDALRRKRIGSYWTQSETYESLKLYIDMDYDGLRESIVQMIGGRAVKLDVEPFQNDLTSIGSQDDVLTLLVHLGYLTYNREKTSVAIPNEEVKREFIRAVRRGKRKELSKLIENSEQLLEDTLSMDEQAVAAAIQTAHDVGTAPNFYNNEQALRSVIRFAYLSCIDEYQEIQELPSGRGYADVVFIPKKNSDYPALLIELKWNKTACGAIEQIKLRNYPQVLRGLCDQVLLVGVNYNVKTKEHTCKIESCQIP